MSSPDDPSKDVIAQELKVLATLKARNEAALEAMRKQLDGMRLSTSPVFRTLIVSIMSGIAGFGLGMSHGAKTAALVFRAENAHRQPTSQKGWYLYHKSKNYYAMFGGAKEGGKMGGKFALCTGGFIFLEEAVDDFRGGEGHRDFLSTVAAALGTSGAWSLYYRQPLITAARTAKAGLLAGLTYGLTQDAIGLAKGRQLKYVEFLKRLSRKRRKIETLIEH